MEEAHCNNVRKGEGTYLKCVYLMRLGVKFRKTRLGLTGLL